MVKKNPSFDAYIKAAAPFAQPILKHLRELVHNACPEVEETIAGLWNEYREARVRGRFGDRDVIIKRARLEDRLDRAA